MQVLLDSRNSVGRCDSAELSNSLSQVDRVLDVPFQCDVCHGLHRSVEVEDKVGEKPLLNELNIAVQDLQTTGCVSQIDCRRQLTASASANRTNIIASPNTTY